MAVYYSVDQTSRKKVLTSLFVNAKSYPSSYHGENVHKNTDLSRSTGDGQDKILYSTFEVASSKLTERHRLLLCGVRLFFSAKVVCTVHGFSECLGFIPRGIATSGKVVTRVRRVITWGFGVGLTRVRTTALAALSSLGRPQNPTTPPT